MASIIQNGKVEGSARVCERGIVSEDARISDHACVGDTAEIGGYAVVRGHATVCGNAWIKGFAHVSGNARISGDAIVSGHACVSGDVKLCGTAKVCGLAVVSEQKHVDWAWFDARSGYYVLTLYMQADGSVGFTWGCRIGTGLRAYFNERPAYAVEGLDVEPLAFLLEFEQANNIGVNK